MIILSWKITLALGLFDFAQEGTGKRPRTLEIRQVVRLFREGLHLRVGPALFLIGFIKVELRLLFVLFQN